MKSAQVIYCRQLTKIPEFFNLGSFVKFVQLTEIGNLFSLEPSNNRILNSHQNTKNVTIYSNKIVTNFPVESKHETKKPFDLTLAYYRTKYACNRN